MEKTKLRSYYFFLLFCPLWTLFAQQSIDSGIEVYSNLPGAKVVIDGEYFGTTEKKFGFELLRVPLEPGFYEVTVEAANYNANISTVIVPEHSFVRHEVVFAESNRTISSGSATTRTAKILTGTITVKTNPLGATVALGNERLGTTANSDLVISNEGVGNKHLEVYFDKNDPGQYLELEFELEADQNAVVIADFIKGIIYIDAAYKVSFNSPTSGAVLVLGETRYAVFPVSLDLPFGEVRYRFEAPGYTSLEETVTVNKNLFINRTLQPLTRTVSIQTQPAGARITIDGFQKGYSPLLFETQGRSFFIELKAPDSYPRLLSATCDIDADIDQSSVTVNHVFQAVPASSIDFRSMDGSRTIPFQIETTVPNTNRNVSLNIAYGKAVQVESGTFEFRVLSGAGSAGTVSAVLKEGTSYQCKIQLPSTPVPLTADASVLPGYRKPPAGPKYLEEYKEKEIPLYDDDFGTVFMRTFLGGCLGACGGLLIGALIEEFDPGEITAISAIAGIPVGAVIGWLAGRTPYGYDTERIPIQANIEKNDVLRAEWQAAVSEVERYNEDILNKHNDDIKSRNNENQRKGLFELRVELTDSNGKTIPVTVRTLK